MVKLVYNYSGYHFEAEWTDESERKEILKQIKYTIKDIQEVIKKENIEKKETEEIKENKKEKTAEGDYTAYASDKQKALMARWGIEYNDNITMKEACDKITEYKKLNKIPERSKGAPGRRVVDNTPKTPVLDINYDDTETIENIFNK